MNDDTDSAGTSLSHSRGSRKPSSPHVRADSTSQKPPSRHSPVSPLAPLEYLQNQRRGSITDPSLHAAATNSMNHLNTSHNAFSGTSLSGHDPSHRSTSSDLRQNSSYTFGDATAQQIRKLLRSPSTDGDNKQTSSVSPSEDSQRSPNLNSRNVSGRNEDSRTYDEMNVDSSVKHEQQMLHGATDQVANREAQHFDYNMRRHSIAVGLSPHASVHGTKRKMSSDRNMFPSVGEEIDPQLAGPGVPSIMNMDAEAPAPKRRGSAVDTQRIAQLSLYDRRNSVDSRGGGGGAAQWWINDRREPTSSMFNTPSLGFGSGFPVDSPHGRPPSSIAAFAWPSNNQPPEQAGDAAMQNEDGNLTVPSRQFDPNMSQLGMMPPIAFAPDRRMSIPDSTVVPSMSTGPTRVLRSRSRPPSRQVHNTDLTNPNQSGQSSSSNTNRDDPASPPSPTTSGKQSNKDQGSTPYSRSPELRVSHKLAERKRRKEMKDLFDELRAQLPSNRGSKSKWEILSKTIDFVADLKHGQQEMAREIDMLRHELENIRQGGIPSFSSGPPHAVVYSQGTVMPTPYPPQTGPIQQHHPHQHHPPLSRPTSSQNIYPPGGGPTTSQGQNGMNRTESPMAQ